MDQQAEAWRSRGSRHLARRAWWRVLRFWKGVRWPVFAGLAVLAVFLGFFGFDSYLHARGIARSFWDKAYLSVQLFPLQSGAVHPPVPLQLQAARILAPLVAAYATISAFIALFRQQITTARIRLLARKHVVVSTLGRTGYLLAHEFTAGEYRVVAIEKDDKNPAIGEVRQDGAKVLVGDPADPTILATARVDRARYLFSVSDDDGANAKVAIDAKTLVEGRRGAPLTCFVQILDEDLAELIEAEIADRPTGSFRLELFNPAERGAPELLELHPPFDERGNTPFGPPHLLVVGLGQMGGRFVVEAARRWWGIAGPNGAKLPVTVVDRNADEHVESFGTRHPHVAKICDLIPEKWEVDDPEFEEGKFLFDANGHHVTSAYVCLGDDARGLAAALRLHRHLRDLGVAVVVRTKQHGGLASLMGDEVESYTDLHVFGLLDLTCTPEVALMGRTEAMARAIHDDYVERLRQEGHTPQTKPNMVPWEDLPEHIRESNRRQADDIPRKLRDIGCRIAPRIEWTSDTFAFKPEEVEELAEKEHIRWMEERSSPWWIFWKRRRGKKEYFVGWEEMPENIKQLDRNAVLGIPEVLAKAGYRVVRGQQGANQGRAGG